MFINWRIYHPEANEIQGDEYVQLPVVVKSFRLLRSGSLRELAEEKAADKLSCVHHEKIVRPKQARTYTLASYPVCIVIYYRPSEFIKKGAEWWQRIDSLLGEMADKWPDTINAETVKKLRADIEKGILKIKETEQNNLSLVEDDSPS